MLHILKEFMYFLPLRYLGSETIPRIKKEPAAIPLP